MATKKKVQPASVRVRPDIAQPHTRQAYVARQMERRQALRKRQGLKPF